MSIDERNYSNLRNNFNKLVGKVLGSGYYNMGMDVATTDKNTCDDLAKKFQCMKDELNVVKGISIGLMVGVIALAVILVEKL